MADVVDPKTRSRMMSGIRGSNTKPELLMRKALHHRGFRFRIHSAHLPGKPDIVLPKYRAIIFVNGCFWHGHACKYFRMPATRPEFWKKKIRNNIERDMKNRQELREMGWRILTVWECSIRKGASIPFEKIVDMTEQWLLSIGELAHIDEKGYHVQGQNQ